MSDKLEDAKAAMVLADINCMVNSGNIDLWNVFESARNSYKIIRDEEEKSTEMAKVLDEDINKLLSFLEVGSRYTVDCDHKFKTLKALLAERDELVKEVKRLKISKSYLTDMVNNDISFEDLKDEH